MKIPKKLKLFGQTINVEFVDNLINDRDAVGLAIYRENKILLQKNVDGTKITKEMMEQTFIHEVTHFIIYLMGENELQNNEKFIDILSSLFHQFLITSEGELSIKIGEKK